MHEVLADHENTWFGSAVGSSNHIATEHTDIQLEINLLAEYMVAPTTRAVRRLKRVVRYAVGMRDHGIRLDRGMFSCHVLKLDICTDSYSKAKIHRSNEW